MKFSQRKGYLKPSDVIQKKGMNEDLRISLWNVLDILIWQRRNFLWTQYGEPEMEKFSKALWFSYFKKPIDARPERTWDVLKIIRDYFFKCEWYEVYDFLEFVLDYFNEQRLNESINVILERELSGYRFVGGTFTDITDTQEVAMLDEAFSDNEFPAVRTHLRRALELLSDRKQPDYRNSIKESISAVESLAQIISGQPKATLGDALKVLERTSKIHPALKEGFSKIYGYTSDEGGIRHAMLDEPNLSPADAKFFLLSCTSFINYLKSKA